MRISIKIGGSFIMAFAVVVAVIVIVISMSVEKLNGRQVSAYLRSSNRARAEHVRTLFINQQETSAILAAASVYRDFLTEATTTEQYRSIKVKIDKRLQRTLEADPHILEAIILDRHGTIVASSDASNEGKNMPSGAMYVQGLKKAEIQKIEKDPVTGTISYSVTAPVLDDAGELIGVSVLRYGMQKINAIISHENGLGSTEDNFIVNRNGYFLTASRFFGSDVILKSIVQTKNVEHCFLPDEIEYVQKNGYAGIESALGISQSVAANDYRNVPIVGTHAYIPEIDGCLITEVDRSELYTMSTLLILRIAGIVFIGLLFFSLISVYLAHAFVRPLRRLEDGIRLVASGDYAHKVGTRSHDEIGALSRSFDAMAATIRKTYSTIDAKVREKTRDIENTSRALKQQQRAMVNVLEDVEEEKAKALALSAIIKDSEEAIYSKDLRGMIMTWNLGAEKLYGYVESEMIGKSVKIIVPKDRQDEVDRLIADIKKGKEVRHFQTKRLHKNGTLLDVTVSVAPIKDAKGLISGISVMAIDISKEAQIDRAKTEFVSLASHQLRTPLSAINWYTEMLLAGDVGSITPKQKEYLEEVYRGNQRMVGLVNSLLNVSRIELGTFAIEPTPTQITAIADEVLKELDSQIKAKQLRLKKKYGRLRVLDLDVKLTRIILQNLLSNAVKYTPEKGSISLTIDYAAAPKGSAGTRPVIITVSDTGYGIPLSQQGKIFTKLFRADNVREKETEGTGLGLYIVKAIMSEIGGEVTFVSKENKGTVFTVRIPASGMHTKAGTKDLSPG